MQHEITASIMAHLQSAGHDVVWIYQGVKLPGTLPVVTIEQMQNNNAFISKGREAVETTYRHQVGLRARTESEKTRIQSEINRIFLFDKIDLLDTTKTPAPVVGSFYVRPVSIVPIMDDKVNDESGKHRVYFDTEVEQITRRFY